MTRVLRPPLSTLPFLVLLAMTVVRSRCTVTLAIPQITLLQWSYDSIQKKNLSYENLLCCHLFMKKAISLCSNICISCPSGNYPLLINQETILVSEPSSYPLKKQTNNTWIIFSFSEQIATLNVRHRLTIQLWTLTVILLLNLIFLIATKSQAQQSESAFIYESKWYLV
jgi:hypothetical protein